MKQKDRKQEENDEDGDGDAKRERGTERMREKRITSTVSHSIYYRNAFIWRLRIYRCVAFGVFDLNANYNIAFAMAMNVNACGYRILNEKVVNWIVITTI